MDTHTYHTGDRIRLTCPTPGGQAGDEAKVVQVIQNADGSIKSLVILIDNDFATIHGTTVFPHEVTKVADNGN
jgi:hypothetical protein